MFLAHSANDDGYEHALKDHLQSVSKISQSLARTQLQKKLSKYAALFHDAGKYQQEFQEYLKHGGPRGSVPHAALGAALARQYSPVIIPFCIEGHHKGLADKEDLKFTLLDIQQSEAFSEIQKTFDAEMQVLVSPSTEFDETVLQRHAGKEFELYIRYLFSILTDADWLDTERHFNPLASQTRQKFELDATIFIWTYPF